jgi:hypothetical protein
VNGPVSEEELAAAAARLREQFYVARRAVRGAQAGPEDPALYRAAALVVLVPPHAPIAE